MPVGLAHMLFLGHPPWTLPGFCHQGLPQSTGAPRFSPGSSPSVCWCVACRGIASIGQTRSPLQVKSRDLLSFGLVDSAGLCFHYSHSEIWTCVLVFGCLMCLSLAWACLHAMIADIVMHCPVCIAICDCVRQPYQHLHSSMNTTSRINTSYQPWQQQAFLAFMPKRKVSEAKACDMLSTLGEQKLNQERLDLVKSLQNTLKNQPMEKLLAVQSMLLGQWMQHKSEKAFPRGEHLGRRLILSCAWVCCQGLPCKRLAQT